MKLTVELALREGAADTDGLAMGVDAKADVTAPAGAEVGAGKAVAALPEAETGATEAAGVEAAGAADDEPPT